MNTVNAMSSVAAQLGSPRPGSPRPFECEDILMAAFLQARGHSLVEIRQHPSRPDRSIFVFERVPSTEADARDFVEDGLAPVRTLARHLSRLRNHVRSERHTKNTRDGNGNRTTFH